jgi:hypothetical protein
MAGQPRQVDLGPVYLPIGEEAVLPAPQARLAEHAARFAALLSHAHPRAGPAGEQAQAVLPSPLHPRARDQRERGRRPAGDSLAAHIQTLWDEQAQSAVREIHVSGDDGFLPGTTLRLRDRCGTLQIDVRCGCGTDSGWVARRLRGLVQALAARLGRPVSAAVFEADGSRAADYAWPGEAA